MQPPPLEHDSPLEPAERRWSERPGGKPGAPTKMSFFKELPFLILVAFGLALLIKSLLVQAFFIPSESMVPTLEINDRVLVNKLVYRFREPRRGEVIVFVAERDNRPRSVGQKIRDFFFEGLGGRQPSERDFIKRVIGLPGETLEYRDSRISITKPSGQKTTLDEPYARRDDRAYGPFTVPAGHYFVMGDNRPNSSDSRFTLGPIKRSDIVGKAFIRIWPPSRIKVFSTPEYSNPVRAIAFGGWAVTAAVTYRYARRRRKVA